MTKQRGTSVPAMSVVILIGSGLSFLLFSAFAGEVGRYRADEASIEIVSIVSYAGAYYMTHEDYHGMSQTALGIHPNENGDFINQLGHEVSIERGENSASILYSGFESSDACELVVTKIKDLRFVDKKAMFPPDKEPRNCHLTNNAVTAAIRLDGIR